MDAFPSRSNFPHFHAVFEEIWQSNRLAPPFGLAPLWEILDPPLIPIRGVFAFYELTVLFQRLLWWVFCKQNFNYHINNLCINSKCIEVSEDSRTLVKRSLFIVLRFYQLVVHVLCTSRYGSCAC